MRDYWNIGFERRHKRIPGADLSVEYAADRATGTDEVERYFDSDTGGDPSVKRAGEVKRQLRAKRSSDFNARFFKWGADRAAI